MSAYAPNLIYEHAVNVLRGYTEQGKTSLVVVAPMAAAVTATVYPGRIVHLNSDHEFELGHAGSEIPMVLLNAPGDPGANRNPETISGNWASQHGNRGGWSAIPCTAACEIETTEFDTAQTYVIGQFLAAVASNTLATGGRISNALGTGVASVSTPFTDAILGSVSREPSEIFSGVSRLAFLTYFLPAA